MIHVCVAPTYGWREGEVHTETVFSVISNYLFLQCNKTLFYYNVSLNKTSEAFFVNKGNL
jgi:hypothetical protein